MLLTPHGPNENQSRNRHQLQLKCAGARQAAHRIAEEAPTNGRASTSTIKLHQQPLTEKTAERTPDGTADAAHAPEPAPKPKAGTGTNCNFNAQEQGKQHIELQKQHPDLPEQAPPHESAPAIYQQKHQQKEQQMLFMPQGPNETQSKNRHQLQLKCTEPKQAAHRIAEAASRTGRASTSTWNCISSP